MPLSGEDVSGGFYPLRDSDAPRSKLTVNHTERIVRCMLATLRSAFARWQSRKKNLRMEADVLIAVHGDKAWDIARKRAISSQQSRDWHIVRQIESQLQMPPRLDTATRYLEDAKS